MPPAGGAAPGVRLGRTRVVVVAQVHALDSPAEMVLERHGEKVQYYLHEVPPDELLWEQEMPGSITVAFYTDPKTT